MLARLAAVAFRNCDCVFGHAGDWAEVGEIEGIVFGKVADLEGLVEGLVVVGAENANRLVAINFDIVVAAAAVSFNLYRDLRHELSPAC
ncbi:hypothetical protein D3C71_2090700 [compost metagenome]